MEGVKFKDVLKSYEERTGEYKIKEKPYDEKKTIENDVNRTVFVGVDAQNAEKVALLKRLLYRAMEEMPVIYMQGMSEVASIFLLYYFDKVADRRLRKRQEDEGLQSDTGSEFLEESETSNNTLKQGSTRNPSMSFIEAKGEDKREAEELVSENRGLYDTLVVVLTNVFRRKFEPLVADDFKLYKENMAVFVEMMKKRRVTISPLGSHVFMGSIFTFFTRDVRDIKNIHKIFEIVLSCPDTALFLLLTVFYTKVSKNERILEVSNDLFPEVIELEKEFLKTKGEMQQKKEGFGMKSALVLGGVASVAAAVFIYRMSRKEKD
jgi:hypothetical protein